MGPLPKPAMRVITLWSRGTTLVVFDLCSENIVALRACKAFTKVLSEFILPQDNLLCIMY